MLGRKWKHLCARYTTDEIILLGLAVSIFISIYTAVIGIVFVLFQIVRQNRIRGLLQTFKGAHYLLLLCPLSLLISLLGRNFMGVLIAAAIAAILLVSLFIRQVMTRHLFDQVVKISFAGSCYCFFIAAMQWLFRSGARKLNFTSTFLNPNLYATITEMIILLGIYQLLSAEPGKRRGPAAVILLNLCSLYLGNCRTAFIALGIAVMVMLVLNRRFKTFALFLGAFTVIAATANMLPQILPKFSSTGSDLAKRISIWKTALRGIWEQPVFGQGGGAYLHVFPRFSGTNAVHTHNIILEVLLDFGLFGTTLLGLYLKEQVKSLASLFGTPEGRRDFSLIAAILTAVVLHGLTDVTFFSVQTSLLLVMCLSVADTRSVRTEFCPSAQPAAAWLEPARKVAASARAADDKQR